MRYSKVVFSAIAAISVSSMGAAFAADLPVKAPPAPPPMMTNWSGCYVGGNVGGGFGSQTQYRTDQIGVGALAANYGSERDSAFIGGGQIGCDYQFSGNGLIGIQGQIDGGSINGSHVLPSFPTFTMHDKITYFDTVTARVGWIFTPQVMGYLKGGVAWARTSDTLLQPSGALSENTSFNRTGATVGAGVEYMFAPGWSVFGEYNYIDFGAGSVAFTAAPGLLPVGEHVNIVENVQTVTVGVNYKFNWGGPVVAKY
jgi:outer membrane immunogenic protein